ncbi:MAG: serine hydrolase domain-containing protein [Polyangiaceae bacterium]
MPLRPLPFAAAPALALLVACSTPAVAIPPAASIPAPPPETSAPAEKAAARPSAHADASRPPESFDVAAIDAWVTRKVHDQSLVGLSLAIMRDGKIVLAKGYGQASREKSTPVEPSTAFGVGSITKQFTCASALLLQEAGKLSLQDKLSKYYPELPRAKQITLADLGAHVSGYPDFYPLDFFDSRMEHGIAADDLIHKYAAEPLDFAPGTRWSYSNTGFIILGRVVEKVSGEPFAKFLGERILKPVGMEHASFAPPAGAPGIATGYESFALGEPQPAPREPEAWMFTAGALFASATDLAKWDLALIDGKVLKAEAYKEMTTPRLLADKRSAGYGCGLSIAQQRGETVLTHGGEVNGFLAENGMVPRTRSAVVLLTNSQFGDPGGIFRTILNLTVNDGIGAAKPPKVNGPSIREAGLEMLRGLQSGKLDRAKLGAEFSLFMNETRVKEASRRLQPLGEPTSTEVEGPRERGGMEVSTLHFSFGSTKLDGLLYRSPDGKVQEFLVSKP